MNRTYRSVWNEALGAWVATSELGGGRRKGAQRLPVGVAVLLLAMSAQAQVKIGDNPATINPGSALEVESTNRGVLMPRIAIADRLTWGLNGNQPVEGMMVYNTNATTGANGLQAGMAVWKGGQWISVDETPYLHVNSTVTGNSTLANSGATGAESVAIGPSAVASGTNAVAIGNAARATTLNSVAVGYGSAANADSSLAMGDMAMATGARDVVIGSLAGLGSASTGSSTFVGGDAGRSQSGLANTSLGFAAGLGSTGDYNIGVGNGALYGVAGSRNVAMGGSALQFAVGDDNVALGNSANTSLTATAFNRTVALGASSLANRDNAVAVGAGAVAVGVDSIAMGRSASSGGGYGDATIAIGADSTATWPGSVAIGQGASATGDGGSDGSVAIGRAASSLRQSVAVGNNSSSAIDSVAIGQSASTAQYGVAMGTSTVAGSNATAIGTGTVATGNASTALGAYNVASAQWSTALGTNTVATADFGVALGALSVANTAAGISGYDPVTGLASTDTSSTWVSTRGAVSVGGNGNTRQITNVAAGTQATDAVNVAQLSTLANTVTANEIHYFSVNSTGGGNENNDGATGADAIAIGKNASSTTTNSVAVGYGSAANAASSIAMGDNATASGDRDVTIGSLAGLGSASTGASTFVGGDAGRSQSGLANTSLGFAAGLGSTGDYNAGVGNGALYGVEGDRNVAMGLGALQYAQGSNNVALGAAANSSAALTAFNNAVALGAGSSSLHDGATAIGSNAVANFSNDVALGAGSTTAAAVNTASTTIRGTTYNFAGTDATSTVSVGSGAAVGGVRTVTNVAAGRISATSTDAINGSQLYATNTAIDDLSVTVAANKTKYYSVNSTGGTNEDNLGATGADAIASGKNSVASGNSSYAAGFGATAATDNSVALGVNANASNGGLVALGMGAQSLAQNTIAIGGTASVRLGIAIGFASNSAGNGAVAIGDATTSSAFSTVALGQSAVATNDYAISMGRLANASNVRATSLGANSIASGTAATAVGGSTIASGNYATATGGRVYFVNGVPREDAYVPGVGFPTATTSQLDTQATGLLSSAYGAAASATADRSLALGALSSATVDGSVALGSGSVSDRAIAGTQGDIPAGSSLIHYNTTDKTLLGAVSVGNATSYRQITNVADGTEQQDAVTVRQLTGALQSFAVTPTLYFHANSTSADSAAVGVESVAIGPQTIVNGDNGIGIGNGATVQASAPGGIAIGQGSTSISADSIALGTKASAAAVQGVSIGAGSNVTQAGGVALGAGSVASTAAGVAGYIPPTATTQQRTAIGATTGTLAAVSVGDAANGQYRQITGVAAGTVDSDAVNVSQLKAVQGQVTQIDQGSVKYDTRTDGAVDYNSVTMGGSNTTGPVTVHNVAEGVAGTDAVNVNQLNAGLEGAKQYTDQRFNQLSGDVRKVAKQASAGTASAIAMANLPQAYIPGKSMVSVGVGGYDGEAGIALGVSKLSDNGRWVVKFSATGNSRSKFGVGAGAGFHW